MSRWRTRGNRRPDAARLLIDPVACEGIGMCAHLAPSLVALDTWGFPLVLAGRTDLRAAKAAVAGCPRRALFLEP